MKKLTLLTAFICAGALAGAPSASAVSAYDNVINLTTDTDFVLQDFEPCNNQSINGTLFWEFMESSHITEQIRNDYMNANSRYLTNIKGQNAGNINNTFLIGYGNNLSLNWNYALTNNAVLTSSSYILVGCKEKYNFFGGTGKPEFYLVESGYNDFATVSYKAPDPDNMGWQLVYFSGNANYPTDYSGDLIPKTAVQKVKRMPTADIHVRDLDIIIGFSPANNDVGNIRANLTAPNGDFVFKDKVFSDYDGYVTNLTVKDYGVYNLTAEFFAPIPYIIPENITPVKLDIDININGDQFSIGTAKMCNIYTGVCQDANELKPCITTVPPGGAVNEDDRVAPYLNIPNCIDNFFAMQHMLAFKTVKIGQTFTNPNECHKLNTLGDWLNVENKTVCAKFPSYIRDTITPFVVFALALTVIAGITKYRGNA